MSPRGGSLGPVAHTVGICESQPVTAQGLRSLLESCPELSLAWVAHEPVQGLELLRRHRPGVLVLDKAFGAQAVLDCLELVRAEAFPTAPVVWAASMTDAEALRFLRAGARGVIRKTADLSTLVSCLLSVARGALWMQPETGPAQPAGGGGLPSLTVRERQVLELIAQGLKNREIARELGIRPGTVKVHLKHIFEKTGVRSRYGLALAGWRRTTPQL